MINFNKQQLEFLLKAFVAINDYTKSNNDEDFIKARFYLDKGLTGISQEIIDEIKNDK